MATSCGIFWDLQNIDVPRNSSADTVVSMINYNIIYPYKLILKDFFVVGDRQTTQKNIDQLIENNAVFEKAGPGRNVADEMIKNRMEEFLSKNTHGSTIILITGDGDFVNTLKIYKEGFGIKIYLIHIGNCYHEKLKQISDLVFILRKDSLTMVHDDIRSKTFVKIQCERFYFPVKIQSEVRHDLGAYEGSFAIINDDDIWCLFEDKDNAENSLNLSGNYTYKSQQFNLITSIESNPPNEVVNLIKCAKLSNQKLDNDDDGTFNMPKYKTETGSNVFSTFKDIIETVNAAEELYKSFNSSSSYKRAGDSISRANLNRPSNQRSNGEECIVS